MFMYKIVLIWNKSLYSLSKTFTILVHRKLEVLMVSHLSEKLLLGTIWVIQSIASGCPSGNLIETEA